MARFARRVKCLVSLAFPLLSNKKDLRIFRGALRAPRKMLGFTKEIRKDSLRKPLRKSYNIIAGAEMISDGGWGVGGGWQLGSWGRRSE